MLSLSKHAAGSTASEGLAQTSPPAEGSRPTGHRRASALWP